MRKKTVSIKTKKLVSFSFDALAKAIYIGFSNEAVEKTVRKTPSFFIDYDKKGEVVGIEIIRVQKVQTAIKKIVADAENNLPLSVRRQMDNYLQPSLNA
ncbi:MAG: DUF2283 domain-containing protein [Candidatus Omnitrophota bacterium]